MNTAVPLLLGGWVAAAAAGARGRPRRIPARAGALLAAARRTAVPAAVAAGLLRRRLPGRHGASNALDRWIGVAAAGGILLAALGHPVLGLVVAGGVVTTGWRASRAQGGRHVAAVEQAVPELLDLLAVAVRAGCTAERAVRAALPHAPAPLQAPLAAVVRRLDRGAPFAEALAALAVDGAGELAALVRLLLAAQLDGVPLEPALERLGDEARRRQRHRVQEAARRLPVRLLVPLVVCILPAFALLTVVPVLVATLGRLQ